MPAAVRDLRRTQSELVIEVLQFETGEAIERLRAGEADVAVVHHLPGVAVPGHRRAWSGAPCSWITSTLFCPRVIGSRGGRT